MGSSATLGGTSCVQLCTAMVVYPELREHGICLIVPSALKLSLHDVHNPTHIESWRFDFDIIRVDSSTEQACIPFG